MQYLVHVGPEGILNNDSGLLLNYLIDDPVIELKLDIVNRNLSMLMSDREFTVPPPIKKN